MSTPEMPRDPRVAAAFRDLAGEHDQLPGDWQAKVWSRIAREPQERRTKRLLRLFQGTTAILALTALVLGFFGHWAYTTGQEADEKERRAKAALSAYEKEVDKARQEIDAAIAEKEKAYQALLDNKNLEDKEKLQAILAQKEKDLKAKRYVLKELRKREAAKAAARRERAKRVNVKCDPSDPLCGL